MRRPLLLAAAALVLLVVVVARGGSAVPSSVPDPARPGGVDLGINVARPSTSRQPGQYSGGDGSAALPYLIVGVLLAVVVVVAVVLSIREAVRRRRLVPVAVPEAGEVPADAAPRVALERAVTRARDLLARPGGAPGDAVIAAWLTLEQATRGRLPHETATEFTAALPADEHALAELRTLYQRARFSTVPTTAADVAQARDALDRVLSALR